MREHSFQREKGEARPPVFAEPFLCSKALLGRIFLKAFMFLNLEGLFMDRIYFQTIKNPQPFSPI